MTIKGPYEPIRESIEGFGLICWKSNILQDVFVGGEEGAVSSHLRVAVSWEGFKKKFSW